MKIVACLFVPDTFRIKADDTYSPSWEVRYESDMVPNVGDTLIGLAVDCNCGERGGHSWKVIDRSLIFTSTVQRGDASLDHISLGCELVRGAGEEPWCGVADSVLHGLEAYR